MHEVARSQKVHHPRTSVPSTDARKENQHQTTTSIAALFWNERYFGSVLCFRRRGLTQTLMLCDSLRRGTHTLLTKNSTVTVNRLCYKMWLDEE